MKDIQWIYTCHLSRSYFCRNSYINVGTLNLIVSLVRVITVEVYKWTKRSFIMTTELKQSKHTALPRILSAVKITKNLTSSDYKEDTSSYHSDDTKPQHKSASSRLKSHVDFISHNQSISRIIRSAQPHSSALNDNSSSDKSKFKLLFGRIPLAVKLDRASRSYGKHHIEEPNDCTAKKLARQNTVSATIYKNTPLTDTTATYREILSFLYKIWEAQMCVSYKQTVSIDTSFKKDQTSTGKMPQTKVKSAVKLRRPRLSVNMSHEMT